MQDSPSVRWVLRLFNGPLRGAEFPLAQPRTLFVVGPEAVFCDAQGRASIPPDALYVPMETSANFEVLLNDNAVAGVMLRLASPAEERPLAAQTLDCVGDLRLAVRPVDEPWAEHLLHPEFSPVSFPGRRRNVYPWAAALGACVLMVALYAAWSAPDEVSDLNTLLQGSSGAITVAPGREGHPLYVFADSERDAAWGRQVLERNPVARARLVTREQESQRLEGLLEREAPAFAWYRVDLTEPSAPRVLFSHQRNLITPSVEANLIGRLSEAAPYARQVSLQAVDDALVARLAEQGLQRLALSYSRIDGRETVTFTLRGSLEDSEREAARTFVTRFGKQWGERYVRFAIELEDDWLKGKSFQYGPDGYVKLRPASWYFPTPDMR